MSKLNCANDNLDVVFLVDGSGSVSEQGFEQIKTFLALVVSQFNLDVNHTQVGINQFSSWQSVEMPLNGYESTEGLATAIQRIPYHNSGTSIGEAIQHALDNTFQKINGDRPCSQDVLIVITDGQDNGNLGITGPVAEATCRGIVTVAVGIGPSVRDSELLAIAGGERNRVFKVDSIETLFEIEDNFCNAIEGKPLNPCISNPCSEYGRCLINITEVDVTFECVCVPGFTGIYCENEINECASEPCQNKGTCNNLINSYTCDCKDGYYGINCQYDDTGCPCIFIYLFGSLLIAALMVIVVLIIIICRRKSFKDQMTQTDFARTETPEPLIIYETVFKEPEIPPPIEPVSQVLPPLDVVFVVDNSGSVGNSNFKKVRSFLTKFLKHLTLMPEPEEGEGHVSHTKDCSLYGLILFNREPRIGIPMDLYDRKALVKLIEKLPYEGHSTSLGQALIQAAKMLISSDSIHGRAKIPKLVLVLSDGYTADNVIKGSSALHSMGAIVLAVGIQKFNPATLELVVNHKRERIFFVIDFDSMKSWLRVNLVQEVKKVLGRKSKKKEKKKRSNRSSVSPSDPTND